MPLILWMYFFSLKKGVDVKIDADTIRLMEEGSVVIDTSINQTAVLETSYLSNLEQPVYTIDGIIYYSVPNISASVPVTASRVITKKILNFLKSLALNDLKETLIEHPGLLPALCIYKGKVTSRSFSERFGHEFLQHF